MLLQIVLIYLICICLFLLSRPALAMMTDAENKQLITPGKVRFLVFFFLVSYWLEFLGLSDS